MDRFEQIIRIRQELFGKKPVYKKDGFPIPSPEGGEQKSDYMSRCMSEISGEYEHEQSIAICLNKYQESMSKQNFEPYNWDECIADQMERYGDEETAAKVCGAIKAGMRKSFQEGDSLENSCWPGYQAIGLKETEDGRLVPNCVPIKE